MGLFDRKKKERLCQVSSFSFCVGYTDAHPDGSSTVIVDQSMSLTTIAVKSVLSLPKGE